MLDFLYKIITNLIEKFGKQREPRETSGKESKKVLELKKYYEEQSKKSK